MDIWGQSKNTYANQNALPIQPYFYSDPKYLLIIIHATTNLYMVVRFRKQ